MLFRTVAAYWLLFWFLAVTCGKPLWLQGQYDI